MLCSMIFYDTSRLARGILCDGKNSSTLCIIRLSTTMYNVWRFLTNGRKGKYKEIDINKQTKYSQISPMIFYGKDQTVLKIPF